MRSKSNIFNREIPLSDLASFSERRPSVRLEVEGIFRDMGKEREGCFQYGRGGRV